MQEMTAAELFAAIDASTPMLIIDIRLPEDSSASPIDSWSETKVVNIPFDDFMADEEGTITSLPDLPLVVVCAKEESSVMVAAIISCVREDASFLSGGINAWGDLLVPRRLNGDGYELWQFIRPAKASCSYLLVSDGRAAVFDPARDPGPYLQKAEELGAEVTHVYETHLQADYISGGPAFDAHYLVNHADFENIGPGFSHVSDDELMHFGDVDIRCIHTPGHTPGSTTYIIDGQWLITGDTVFIRSVGRPDLGNRMREWALQLFDTLKERICNLPEDMVILPGHFTSWAESEDGMIKGRFGDVLAANREIYGIEDPEHFVSWVERHMREQPEEYSRIRRVNAGIEQVDDSEAAVLDLGKNQCAASVE